MICSDDKKKHKLIHLGPKSQVYSSTPPYHTSSMYTQPLIGSKLYNNQNYQPYIYQTFHPINQPYKSDTTPKKESLPQAQPPLTQQQQYYQYPIQYAYQTVPVETIEYKTVPVETVEYKQVPITEVSYQRVPIQNQNETTLPQASAMRESIQGESHIEYVPFERSYYEQVPVEKVDYVPVEKREVDYYAIERQREYVPVSRMEKVQELVPQETIEYVPQTRIEYIPQYRTEMVPIEKVEEKMDYQPVERSVIHYPRYEKQFYEEAERSGRIRPDYAGFFSNPGFVPPRAPIMEPLPPVIYQENLHYSNPPPRYLGPEFVGAQNYGYQGYEVPVREGNYYSGKGFNEGNETVGGGQYENENFERNNFGVQYEPFDRNSVRPAENLNLMKNRLNDEYGRPQYYKY